MPGGMLGELPLEDPAGLPDRLFRREFTVKPINSMPRWLPVENSDGLLRARGFMMNRATPHYAGRLPLSEVAVTLARALGIGGGLCAEHGDPAGGAGHS